jgi:signal transduction histidine kinase
MLKSIKSKFIFFSVALILLTTVLPISFLVGQLRENFEDRSIVMLNTTMEIVRYGLKFAMMTGKQEDLGKMISELSKKEGIYLIRIFDREGIINLSSNASEMNKKLSTVAPHHIDPTYMSGRVITRDSGEKIYSSTEPIINEKPCQSCHQQKEAIAFLDVDTNLTLAENKFYTGSLHMIFLGGLVILFLIVGLYFIFYKFINLPLKNLVAALDDVESGNLDVRLNVNGNDEMNLVYKHFNAMTYKIKSSRDKIEHMHLEELQRLNRLNTLGELTSQTAHEVNNHIAIMMARTDYLDMEAKEAPALSKYSEDFSVLQDQVSKISSITGNILKYSRKQTTEFKEINLVNIIDEIKEVFKPILVKRNIELTPELKVDDGIVTGDSVQLYQVITNLINNASDAIVKGGKIIISLFKDENGRLSLQVKDNGPGIKKDIINEIFSPFFTTKTIENNTGLGLYIVKKICDRHKAELVCSSEENTGTTFTIKF